uniref:Uncharacterized protein n=1 Tax=Arundo donax TaxID=35708 RepID=A0A0A8XTU7_ARUDO
MTRQHRTSKHKLVTFSIPICYYFIFARKLYGISITS